MSKWDELTMAEKAEMMKVAVRNGITKLQDIRDKYNEFAEGGGISDEEYYSTMEKVAEDNYQKWGLNSPDEALVHALNDNTYNYRGYYNKYPQSEANADTHWTDEFKTVYHPTFSVESSYSGQESQYNPQGLYGGHWVGDKFIPAPWQLSNTFKGGGYKPSDSVKKRISTWEGAAMTGAIDPLSGKWGKNRSFEAEAASFYDALPSNIREHVLSNPELADNLFSYSYNVGAGNFKKRVVPALKKYYTGNGSSEEIANSMWATGDKKLRGLRNRRAVEKKGVVDALTPTFIQEPTDNTFVFNPFAIQAENTYQRPIIIPDEDSYVTAHEVSPSEQKAQEIKERFNAINRFNTILNMLNMDTTAPTYTPDTGNPFLDAIGLLTNSNANGGKIHIKPENRGKFTALKKRTGHSATWFKQHGTPAQKKMATFALNARHWKHGLGGDLNTYNYGNTFDGGGLFGNETVDTVASFLPIVGTAEDAYQFYKDPSWANAGWLALSLGSDIFTGGMAARGIKALRMANKAHDAAQVASRAARRTWEAGKAANTAQSGSVKGADMRRMINSVGAAGATRQAAIKRANDALFEAGVAAGIDQGLNGFINAAQMDLLPDFGLSYEQKHGFGGNLFEDGGDSNPMNYDYKGTIYDDELKKEGITHVAELPEITIKGRDLTKPYRSAFDGSVQPYIEYFGALSHGLQPLSLSQHVGAAADAIQGKRNYFDSLFNGNSGFFSDEYAAEHPITTIGGNLLGDIAGPMSFLSAVNSAKNAAQPFTSAALGNTANIQHQTGTALSGPLEETIKAIEKGRNDMLDWIRSPFYKARLRDEPLYRVADDVVNDASQMIENAPIRVKDRMQLDKNGNVNGTTTTRPAIEEKVFSDGTKIIDLNTGLDVDIASDLGEQADKTTLHELLHYMTANSKGIPYSKAGERIINKGWMEPTETHFDAINIIHKNRSKGWQDYILDQNDVLLPKYDEVVKMVMERPEDAKAALIKTGRTPADADAAVQSLRNRYSEWYDIQEQRAYLQELFLSKIKPNLKNPNDAAEIEAFMSKHPEILDGSPAYKYIQEVRPGTLKQYAGYFASALSTLPFINKMTKE